MRLIFSSLYRQYRSLLTQTAFDLGPSSISTCSGMAVQCLSVEQVLDMSGGVGELHENGSTEHRAAVCHLFVLNSETVSPQQMENFSRPLEMMQCQEHKPFASTKCFPRAEPLLKMSSAADDHQQQGHVTTQLG